MTFLRVAGWFLIATVCIATNYGQAAHAKDIIFIFDGSGSMNGKTRDGKLKINVGRDVLIRQIERLDEGNTNAGLIAYGHRVKGDCKDIEQLVEIKPLSRAEIVGKISTIRARGKTPIADSIRIATEQLATTEEEATIVLISDGDENCEADPCQVAGDLKDAGVNFVLHAVGFDVNEQQSQQLQCLANITGGQYFSAEDEAGLAVALQKAVELEPATIVQENIEIILDTSQAMSEEFDGTTKLAAARGVLQDILGDQVKDRDNLAFRTYGGTCGSGGTVLHNGFAQNSGADISQSLQGLRADGDATIKAGVLAAVRDFQDERRFPEDVRKRVIIIAGGRSCGFNDPYDIQEALRANNIKIDFYPIGMKIPPNEMEKFKEIGFATGREIRNVNSAEELKNLLTNIIEIEPVKDSIDQIQDIIYQVIDDTNNMVDAANAGNDSQAEELRIVARGRMDGTARTFSDLRKRAVDRRDFGRIYELAASARKMQSDNLAVAKLIIQLRGDGNTAESNAQVNKYNQTIAKMNDTMTQINALVKKLTF